MHFAFALARFELRLVTVRVTAAELQGTLLAGCRVFDSAVLGCQPKCLETCWAWVGDSQLAASRFIPWAGHGQYRA